MQFSLSTLLRWCINRSQNSYSFQHLSLNFLAYKHIKHEYTLLVDMIVRYNIFHKNAYGSGLWVLLLWFHYSLFYNNSLVGSCLGVKFPVVVHCSFCVKNSQKGTPVSPYCRVYRMLKHFNPVVPITRPSFHPVKLYINKPKLSNTNETCQVCYLQTRFVIGSI